MESLWRKVRAKSNFFDNWTNEWEETSDKPLSLSLSLSPFLSQGKRVNEHTLLSPQVERVCGRPYGGPTLALGCLVVTYLLKKPFPAVSAGQAAACSPSFPKASRSSLFHRDHLTLSNTILRGQSFQDKQPILTNKKNKANLSHSCHEVTSSRVAPDFSSHPGLIYQRKHKLWTHFTSAFLFFTVLSY